jgi:hypothetical protein
VIDLSREELLTLAQAGRVRPPGRKGRPLHPSTIYRWISRGLRGVRLEAIRLGGTLYTSREALQRFAERLTHSSFATAPSAATNQPTSPPRASNRNTSQGIEAELEKLGL